MASTTIRIVLAVFFVAVVLVFVQGDVGYGYRRRDRASISRCPNPRLYFRNGVAKLRFRGRVAKYMCLPGFTLFGESVATCYAGRWDRPVPICAAPGCRIPSRDLLSRGTVENFRNRGVMLLFRCRAGYALNGSSKAFCDGRSWNTTLPRCVPLVANPELSCDFEDPELCGWTADLSGSNQFTRTHLEDEEGDASGNGHFMTVQYIGHPGLVEDVFPVARLTSPVFRPLTVKACFRFWYKLPCSLCSLRLLVWTSDTLNPVWSTYGPRDLAEVNVSLSAVSEDFQLVFEARPSRKDITGLVIDDVRLELSECYVAMATEDIPTTIVADNVQNEISTNKEELGGVSDTVLPETIFTTAPPATNAVETSSALGSSSTELSTHNFITHSSAATANDGSTARLPIRETSVQATLVPEATTALNIQPRVTEAITLTSAQKETTPVYVHSTSILALTSASENIVTSATGRPVLKTTVNQTFTGPWNTTTSVVPAQQTLAKNRTGRPAWTKNMSQTFTFPQKLSTTATPKQRATRRYYSTSVAFSVTSRTAVTITPTTSTQSHKSANNQTSTAFFSETKAPPKSLLNNLSSSQETSNVKFSPTWMPSGTRSQTSSPSTQTATTRMIPTPTPYKPYTARRLTTYSRTSTSAVYAIPTRQSVTLLPPFTRYTRNTRYPLRNRTVSYVPTTQAPSARTTGIVSRFPGLGPRVFTRASTVSPQPTAGKPFVDAPPTTRKSYATLVHGTTLATGVMLVTTQRDLKPRLLGATSRAVTFKTVVPTTEGPKSSHSIFAIEGTMTSGASTRTTSGLPTKPAKPTRKTVKPYNANDFTRWTKKPSLKTVAPVATTPKRFTPSWVHTSSLGDWVREENAFPSESPGANSGDQVPGAADTPGYIDDNEIPLLNSVPSRNQGYMAKPQQSASVEEKGLPWSLLALKIGMATACALGLALVVMFIMLRCRKRPASGLGDDSEMKPLSQFEQSDAADGAS